MSPEGQRGPSDRPRAETLSKLAHRDDVFALEHALPVGCARQPARSSAGISVANSDST